MKQHFAIWVPALLLLAAGCTRAPQETVPPAGEQLLLSLDTKGLTGGERTFRVALYTGERNYTGRSGAYCTSAYTYAAAGYTWLQPCKVNEDGAPLDAGDNVVESLSLADHAGTYGLNWVGGSTDTNPARDVEMVALSPAVEVYTSGAGDQYAYVNWHLGTDKQEDALYISESVPGSFSGSWMDKMYVYDSDASFSGSMKDPRAAVKIRIICGRLEEGDVRSVTLSNRVTDARYYLVAKDDIAQGFYLETPSLYTTDSQTLYTCPTDSPMHITTDPSTEWTSAEILLPAMAYSALPDTRRPVVTVMLGNASLSVPFTARVVLNQDLDPQTEYTYTLQLSKTYVYTYFAPTLSWDAAGNIQSIDNASPVYLGSVAVGDAASGWEEGGGGTSEGWN